MGAGPSGDIGTAGCERDGMKPTESAAPASRLQGFLGPPPRVGAVVVRSPLRRLLGPQGA